MQENKTTKSDEKQTGGLSRNSRIQELDVLRGIAVLLVLGRHVLFIPDGLPQFLGQSLIFWRKIGWIGVDLFFVISGFLVSGLLFSEWLERGRINLGRFLIRRAFKIYPPFYLLLLTTIAVSNWLGLDKAWKFYFYEAIFVQNYAGGVWNHTWSLAVEEHFYLFLTLLFFLLRFLNRRGSHPFSFLSKLMICLGVELLLVKIFIGLTHPPGQSKLTLNYTHLRIDSLLFGVFLAYHYHLFPRALSESVRKFRLPLTITMLTAWVLPSVFSLEESWVAYTVGFTVLYLGFGALLLLALFNHARPRPSLLRYSAPLLVPIGRASYSIYLWHMPIYWMSRKLLLSPDSTTAEFMMHLLSYQLGSVIAGCVMFRLVELPSLRLRQRWFP